MKKFYPFILLLFAFTSSYSQCMLYPVDLSSRINNSSLIVEGKVVSKKSYWNSTYDFIFTSNLVSITQTLKGNAHASFIEVITIGGQVDLVKQTAEPSLELGEEESGIFMVNPATMAPQYGYNAYMVHTDQQGFIKFNKDGTAKEPFRIYSSVNGQLKPILEEELGKSLPFFNSMPVPAQIANVLPPTITSFAPSSITAGTASQLTITGTGFGATQGTAVVRFQDADNGGGANWIQPHATQYISWSNTQIVVQVPTKTSGCGTAGTGPIQVVSAGTVTSGSNLTVTHGQLNVFFSNTVTPATQIFNTRHHGLNGSGGMTWRMNTSFNANVPAKTDFQTAFGTWRCATYINWQIGSTVATNTIASDGVNVIGFDNVVIPPGGALPGGVLGVCYSWFSGCTTGTNIAWHVAELDIIFDNGTNWQYGAGAVGGTQLDFESVVLHELGHGHQLSHVIDNLGVMHWSIAAGQIKNTLNGNDIAGGNAVMARNVSGPVCGNPIMVALTPSTCALAAPTASFNIPTSGCVGQTIPLNDISTNNPNVWAWTMPGGSPASSTLQNTSTVYSTTGIKSITLVATNGTGSTSITRTINIAASPTLAVTSGSTCAGGTVNLTSSGTTSYTWNPGALTGSAQALSPGGTTAYTVTGSNGTCTNTAIGTVTIVSPPVILVAQSSTSLCTGESATITIAGGTSYTTNPGALSGSVVVVTPSATSVYTILGTSGSVCTGSNTVAFSVSPCTTGLPSQYILDNMQLYPNPTKDNFTLKFATVFNGEVKVVNAIGQLIYSKKINNTETLNINLSEYAKGIYSVKVSGDDNSSKIIKVVKE